MFFSVCLAQRRVTCLQVRVRRALPARHVRLSDRLGEHRGEFVFAYCFLLTFSLHVFAQAGMCEPGDGYDGLCAGANLQKMPAAEKEQWSWKCRASWPCVSSCSKSFSGCPQDHFASGDARFFAHGQATLTSKLVARHAIQGLDSAWRRSVLRASWV